MARLVDLTHTVRMPMPTYPGDPAFSLMQIATIEANGCTDHLLQTSMHVGTHMDAPLHMIEGGAYLSDIDAEHFIGSGRYIDARNRQTIDVEILKDHRLDPGDIVLVHTGHSEKYGTDDYFSNHPVLTDGFAQAMAACGVHCVGMDMPSPDTAPFTVHKTLLAHGILIIENLTNLDALRDAGTFTVIALPPKLRSDAAPVRVIAMIA